MMIGDLALSPIVIAPLTANYRNEFFVPSAQLELAAIDRASKQWFDAKSDLIASWCHLEQVLPLEDNPRCDSQCSM